MTKARFTLILLLVGSLAVAVAGPHAWDWLLNPLDWREERSLPVTGDALAADEFVGPFPSWNNVKRDYGAVGNGIADDTTALQRALNDLASPSAQVRKSSTLYIPSGTYKITRTLNLKSKLNSSIQGEHPDTTKIRWEGPVAPNSAMLWIDGVSYSQLSRLTWEGNGVDTIIGHWWETGANATTGIRHEDEVFRNANFCMQGGGSKGANDSEVWIYRSKFINCSSAGIVLNHMNVLQWFVWDSYFENNGEGIMGAAGQYHAYRNHFKGSRVADMSFGVCYKATIRDNVSEDSEAFFDDRCGGWFTLHGNIVLNPRSPTPISGEGGYITLIDNIIKARPGQAGPAVKSGYTFSVGNTFTVSPPIDATQIIKSIDDQVLPPNQVNPTIPALPQTPPNRNRPIFEIPPEATQAASASQLIQQKINEADQRRGQRPVVHFPDGEYSIDQTLTIPAGSDIQLVADQNVTLGWSGQGTGPILRLAGPSHATLRYISFNGGDSASALLIDNADQASARVYLEASGVSGQSSTYGLLAEGIDNAKIIAHNFGTVTDGVGVRVIGGPQAAAGQAVEGGVSIFGENSCCRDNLHYDVQRGGKLLVQNTWYEDPDGDFPNALLTKLTDSGTLTLTTGFFSPAKLPGNPIMELDNFRGKFTLFDVGIDVYDATSTQSAVLRPRLVTRGEGRETNLLLYNVGSQTGNLDFVNQATNTRYANFDSATNSGLVNDLPFLRSMIAQLRNEKPTRLTTLPAGVTDVRLFWVTAEHALAGIYISSVTNPSPPPPPPLCRISV